MPLPATLKLDGIQGTGIQAGRLGEILVLGFTLDVDNEISPLSGLPVKSRIHSFLKLQKNLDLATPALRKAHQDGTVFQSAHLKLYHMPRSGPEVHYFSIILTKAQIGGIQLVMPDVQVALGTPLAEVHEYEELSLSYESIAWAAEPPPSGGLDSGSYTPYTTKDVQVRFAPDWMNLEAKGQVKALYGSIKDSAQKKFEELLKKTKAQAK